MPYDAIEGIIDPGVRVLRDSEGNERITIDNIAEHISEERALKIVADMIDAGIYSPGIERAIELLKERYGSKIEDVYAHELTLLARND